MPDIIHLLPDSVANQIAAGEVIQRPASVVKELLENSVDAGATSVKLIVKDAGKALVQVVDNGCGMSETDARMCFERHATSKIRKADDLFAIRTMGFRGEAMASIAAIAQVEMKTRRREDELGTKLEIEGSKIVSHEACGTAEGTSISVKNLFYNVPARRKFLKSPAVEMRHIIDEFQRVALAYPGIAFSLYHNDNDVFILEKGTFRQRILGVSGKNYNEKLVPVEEETTVVKISGFIGKPECAKKVRGEQFFFVNNRFIKNAYLHHAIANAFTGLIADDCHPSYFLCLYTDPGSIDINIHPTKTEIKFEDEKTVYSIIRAAVKQSLGKYNIAPSLDFSQDNSFEISIPSKNEPVRMPVITVNPDFNPFKTTHTSSSGKKENERTQPLQPGTPGGKIDWEKIYHPSTPGPDVPAPYLQSGQAPQADEKNGSIQEKSGGAPTFQLHGKYILSQIKSGMLLIHQQRAHERILYEKFLLSLENNRGASQQLLFPQTLEFSAPDFEILKELNDEIKSLGFDISLFGKNTFVINGIPAEAVKTDAKELLEKMLEYFKNSSGNFQANKKESLARSLAKIVSVKKGEKLEKEEMNAMIDELFACEMPYVAPNGKPTIITVSLEDLEKRFQ